LQIKLAKALASDGDAGGYRESTRCPCRRVARWDYSHPAL